MVRTEAEGNLGTVPSGYKAYWRIYRGDPWEAHELAVFKASSTYPFALNEIAALIDTYVAKLDPESLEPTIEAEDGESAPFQQIGQAFLAKARKNAKVSKVEKSIPRHQFIQGVTGSFCSVYSDNGRMRHRVEILQPEEIRYDSRSMLPNAQDSIWRAFVRGYTAREVRTNMPDVWKKLKKNHLDEDGKLDQVVTSSQGLFEQGANRQSPRQSSYIELCWIEWKEHRSYLLIPTAVLTDYDKAAAHEHGFEITVDGLRLEGDERADFEKWMELYQQDPALDRATRWEGEAFYYAVVAGSQVLEQGLLPEGCFRIHLACGPPVKLDNGSVTYRSLVDDNYGAQRLLNHTVTGSIVAVGRSIKGLHIISKNEDEDAELELNGSRPGAVVRLSHPEGHEYISADSAVLTPMMQLVDLAKRSMQTRMGTSDFSQGRIPEGDKLTRTSSKALENLLANADAPVKAYYEAYIEWRLELAMCMLRQITHWDFEDLARMVGPELVAPMAEALAPQTSIPSGALWQIEIDLREPQRDTDAQVAASVVGQGVLPQLIQLGIAPPPRLMVKIVTPLFAGLSKADKLEWESHVEQMQLMQQQQPAQPEQEVTN